MTHEDMGGGIGEGMDDPRAQAEGEVSMARLALEDGETGHAAAHVAAALAHDPALPEAHEMLARLLAGPGGGPDLFPVDEPVFLGTALARAHALAARGEYVPALRLLISVQRHEPGGRWAHVPWVLDPELPGRIPPGELCSLVSLLASGLPGTVPEDGREALLPYVVLVRGALRAHPDDASLLWLASLLLRRVGEAEEAVELAVRSYALAPSFQAALAEGYACRDLQRWPEAERAMVRALEHDPANLALYTDIGEMLHSSGRPQEGLEWVERALRREPRHPNAYPTACGMRFERDGDVRHLVELADHLRDDPGNEHGDAVLGEQCGLRLWLGRVPGPTESVIDVLYQMVEREEVPAGGELTVSAPEPPSALLAFSLVAPGFALTIADAPDPDARLTVPEVYAHGPVRGVTRRVWRYEGMTAVPAVPPPSREALESIAAVATLRWPHLPAAYDHAVRLSGLSLGDLLGVLVHPPLSPYGEPAAVPLWIRQVQAWACLGIAHHQAGQPWAESERRSVLTDLAYGPEDWVTEAALLGMIATAWMDPDAREDVAELVAWRYLAAVEASKTRPVTILGSLAALVLATPGMHPDVRALATEE
ncbi:tetratricopeptide repeat protein [Microbispora siamensis]|uniref:Tetratricopeptide repeat protein n=1 Tax=Microbispora siamensis TaxID=564413 RepID=A0ABQ4H0U7_9ACTN|nr:tetratricopeptide repeat protein [Microbispora siamensis]GIH67292.1 hypothetical protein Msi02_81090 [Microbispora siamensis]